MNAGTEVGKALVALVPWGLTIGGVIAGVWGLASGHAELFAAGLGAVVLGQIIYPFTRGQMLRDMDRWAREAVDGYGPVPPRDVQLQIMNALRAKGVGPDTNLKSDFERACRRWAIVKDMQP